MDTGPDNYAEIIFEHTHITSISDGIKFHPTCYTTEVKWVRNPIFRVVLLL